MKSIQSSRHKAEPPATLLCPRNPEILKAEMQPVQHAIARRAFELFEKRGSELGHDWGDRRMGPLLVRRSSGRELGSLLLSSLLPRGQACARLFDRAGAQHLQSKSFL
jgi:hypothetical protein